MPESGSRAAATTVPRNGAVTAQELAGHVQGLSSLLSDLSPQGG